MTQFQRDALVASIEAAVPVVERLIALTNNREIRDRMVVRLALLDRNLSALRDMPVLTE